MDAGHVSQGQEKVSPRFLMENCNPADIAPSQCLLIDMSGVTMLLQVTTKAAPTFQQSGAE